MSKSRMSVETKAIAFASIAEAKVLNRSQLPVSCKMPANITNELFRSLFDFWWLKHCLGEPTRRGTD